MVTRDSAAKCSNRLAISSLAFLSLAKGFVSSVTITGSINYGKYKEVQKPRETKEPSEMTETLNVRRRVI
jgi:hypothetical protein